MPIHPYFRYRPVHRRCCQHNRHMYFRYNETSGCVGDDDVEPGDIENMDAGVGILFLAVLYAEIVLLPVLDSRHIYFRYIAMWGN